MSEQSPAPMIVEESIEGLLEYFGEKYAYAILYENGHAIRHSMPASLFHNLGIKAGDSFWINFFRQQDGSLKAIIPPRQDESPPTKPERYLSPSDLEALSDSWSDDESPSPPPSTTPNPAS